VLASWHDTISMGQAEIVGGPCDLYDLGFAARTAALIIHGRKESRRMNWSRTDVDRLHELYVGYVGGLQTDVAKTNRALGSANPDRTKLELLSRDEFERHINPPHRDVQATHSWLRRIARGHEREFPGLESASGPPQRATGT
jgi:hypothetical protein